MASPLLKWAGGKSWLVPTLAPEIAAVLADTGGRYIEPFAGGAAVGLHLEPQRLVLNDALPILMDLYRIVRDAPNAVEWALQQFIDAGTDKETYMAVRARVPTSRAQRAAWMLYVNRLGFNGLYRENKSGRFNVPYGRPGEDPFGVVFERLPAVSAALAGADLRCGDFRKVIASAGQGDVIYADPPYDGVFDSYTAARFDASDQQDLASALAGAAARGARVYATNSDTGLVRSLYQEWAQIAPTREPRAISSAPDDRGPAPCVLLRAAPWRVGSQRDPVTTVHGPAPTR